MKNDEPVTNRRSFCYHASVRERHIPIASRGGLPKSPHPKIILPCHRIELRCRVPHCAGNVIQYRSGVVKDDALAGPPFNCRFKQRWWRRGNDSPSAQYVGSALGDSLPSAQDLGLALATAQQNRKCVAVCGQKWNVRQRIQYHSAPLTRLVFQGGTGVWQMVAHCQ